MVLRKGFIFSVDAAIALALVTATFALMFSITGNTAYSRLKYYDEQYYLQSIAMTVKSHPGFGSAVDSMLQGRDNQARARIRNILRQVGVTQKGLSVSIAVYNESSEVDTVRASWPRNSWPEPSDSVSAVRMTFAQGDHVGTIQVRSW